MDCRSHERWQDRRYFAGVIRAEEGSVSEISNNEYSYHNYQGGQWVDYSGGLIFGHKFNKHLGVFAEGKYNKYWNRKWHNFSIGVNYVIF